MARVFVGHDRAEAHHDVHVEDEAGRRLTAMRLPESIAGVHRFHELVGALRRSLDVTVATETDRGLFVGSLVGGGYRGCWRVPDVDLALSGAALDLRSQVRSR